MEEREATRLAQEAIMEERRKQLLSEDGGYWRQRMAAEEATAQQQRLHLEAAAAKPEVWAPPQHIHPHILLPTDADTGCLPHAALCSFAVHLHKRCPKSAGSGGL